MSGAVSRARPAPPVLPSDYGRAVACIRSLETLEEGRHWSDRAEALAAWARIYRDDEVGRQARRLRLHALRRLAELAGGLGNGGAEALRAFGFTAAQVRKIRGVGRVDPRRFAEAVEAEDPPATYVLLAEERTPDGALKSLRAVLHFADRVTPSDAAAAVNGAARGYTAQRLPQLLEWLRRFARELDRGAR